MNIRSQAIVRGDRIVLLNFPCARGETIRFGRQRADRAEIDHVARQLRGHGALEIGRDLHVLAAKDRADLLDPGDLGREADAARAMDAAGHDRLDQRPHLLVGDGALVLDVAAVVDAVGHRLVLQIALAALVADRAVERMVDQQELHHPLAGLDRTLVLGVDHHALGDRHRAGRDGLRRFLDVDQAHAAVAGDRQALVEAEMRHLDADRLAGLEDREPVLDLDLASVDGELCHAPPLPQAACFLRSRMRRSISGRKCRIRPWTGQAAASPSAQMVWPSTW